MRRLTTSRALGALIFCAALPAAAQALDLPTRKAGLWEIKMIMNGTQVPAMSMQQCTDETTDKQMGTMFGPMQQSICPKKDIQKTANGFTVDTVCNSRGGTLTAHSEVSGDFNAAYTVKMSTHTEGGPASRPDANMVMEAKWLGACKPGQKAGDMVMPGGITMNIKELEELQDSLKK